MDMPPMTMAPMANGPGMDMGSGGMQMTFYWGKQLRILFDSWRTKNVAQYIFSLLAILAFAVLHQWLDSFRHSLASVSQGKPSPVSSTNLEAEAGAPPPTSRADGMSPLVMRSLLAVLFAINAATGYSLMLLVMSYNGGVFIAVILGLFIGYFIFQGKLDTAAHPHP